MITRLLSGGITLYRAFSASRLPVCRFWPSCSVYAGDAIAEHGAVRGTALALRRLLRCHPWGGYGVDPVPAPVQVVTDAPLAPNPAQWSSVT